MDTHFFIEKISALKKDFYPIRPGLLDAKAHLDIYKCVAGCTAFQFCHMVLPHNPGCAYVRCPWPGLMIEFHAKPPRCKSRHISPAIQFSAYIIGKKAQIDLVRFYGKDRFRFRAVKSGSTLRKILHQKFAVWIERSGIVSTIGHAITIDIGTAHENIVVDPVVECIDFPGHGTGGLA